MRRVGWLRGSSACAGCGGSADRSLYGLYRHFGRSSANNERVKQLAADKGLKTTQNVAAGVAGIFIPVLWFGMDFQGTADTEITALQSRQQYLSMLADQKRCGAEPEPPPPRGKRPAKSTRPAAPPTADAERQENVPAKQ